MRWLRQWGSRSTKWQDAFKRLQGQPDRPRLCNAMTPVAHAATPSAVPQLLPAEVQKNIEDMRAAYRSGFKTPGHHRLYAATSKARARYLELLAPRPTSRALLARSDRREIMGQLVAGGSPCRGD